MSTSIITSPGYEVMDLDDLKTAINREHWGAIRAARTTLDHAMSRPDLHRFPEARTAIEDLLSSDERRVSINQHAAFLESLTPPALGDELEDFIEELRAAEFEVRGARP